PTSSVFDILTYGVMFFLICPMVMGGAYNTLDMPAQISFMMLFQTGWFVESLWSQTLVIHMIRSPKIPFIRSRASWQLTALTTIGIAVGTLIPYTPIGVMLGMSRLPKIYFAFLLVTVLAYMVLATIVKKLFIKRYGELL
ncbi:MAG: cation transporting ATPase C-terminal domain-containing protein, partial [Oscillospiraceae bacterium]